MGKYWSRKINLATSLFVGCSLALISFTMGAKTHDVVYAKTYTFSDVKPIFKARCYICHNKNSGRGDWQDYDQAFKKRLQIKTRVKSKNMPMGNVTRMTDEERDVVIKWVEQGAKK